MLHILGIVIKIIAPLIEKLSNYKYKAEGYLRKCFYEVRLLKCGENLQVNGKPRLFGLNNITIGNNVTINDKVQIAPRGKVIIDDYVVMSRGSQITAGELDTSCWTGEGYKTAPHRALDVHIGEGCWLCVNSTVLPGGNISGKGVIVAAGAVVTKDIKDDYVIVGGVPAKILKKLD